MVLESLKFLSPFLYSTGRSRTSSIKYSFSSSFKVETMMTVWFVACTFWWWCVYFLCLLVPIVESTQSDHSMGSVRRRLSTDGRQVECPTNGSTNAFYEWNAEVFGVHSLLFSRPCETPSLIILVNLSDWKYWRFCFSELWEVIAQDPYPLQLWFCHIWAQQDLAGEPQGIIRKPLIAISTINSGT